MSQVICILASCALSGVIYALMLFGIDRLLAKRHTVAPVIREQLIMLAVVVSAAPALVRMAKHYADAERRIRLEGRR